MLSELSGTLIHIRKANTARDIETMGMRGNPMIEGTPLAGRAQIRE